MTYYEDSMLTLILGDCVVEMAKLPAESVDAVVTDPPYGLEFMGKEWDRLGAGVEPTTDTVWTDRAPGSTLPFGGGGQRVRYGKSAKTMQAWHESWAREAFRVAKPGAHLLAFGGTRTYHRLASAIEDAGWEIRDCLVYAYASGFPKSLNVAKQPGVCHCGALPSTEHDVHPLPESDVPEAVGAGTGSGTVLLEAMSEPSVSTATLQPEEGQLWAAERLVEGRGDVLQDARQLRRGQVRPSSGVGEADGPQGRLHHGAPSADGAASGPADESNGSGEPHRPPAGEQRPLEPGAVADQRGPQARGSWPLCDRCGKPQVDGWGTALKPAWEPIVLARKPLRGTVAQSVLEYGTGALNIDATRIGVDGGTTRSHQAPYGASGWRTGHEIEDIGAGRWPANLILTDPIFDGGVPGVVGGGAVEANVRVSEDHDEPGSTWALGRSGVTPRGISDSGTYSRFFLIPKAGRSDREPVVRGRLEERFTPTMGNGIGGREHDPALTKAYRENLHPTVKPLELMRHLVRLVTPPGGTVLDCFLGSGSTAISANAEGFRCIGIEREREYVDIAVARLAHQPIGMGLDVGAPTRKRTTPSDAKMPGWKADGVPMEAKETSWFHESE